MEITAVRGILLCVIFVIDMHGVNGIWFQCNIIMRLNFGLAKKKLGHCIIIYISTTWNITDAKFLCKVLDQKI